ncbi:MAG: GNAT family N-acetyltransferase [Candidatus Aenigmarchaeota archaeon]|nr:GNAT family N-acetyltransferase [Candidatus Aenigmarchaeota archaeon]
MQVQKNKIVAQGIKFSILEEENEVARAYLYILPSDSPFAYHSKPFGFMTGVFVETSKRGQGYGTAVLKELIEVAKQECYKLITTSRDDNPEVHKLYERLGFHRHGKEFRIDFE